MHRYVALLRGINVGGRNKVPMAALRTLLEELGFERVRTYIASGNVLLSSPSTARETAAAIEAALPGAFTLGGDGVRVLVLTERQLRSVIQDRPDGFGDEPDRYHSDAIFLFDDLDADTAMAAFNPREGVDTVWPGKGVIYSQRLSAERTKSRLSKVMGTPAYRSMTIRNWATTTTLLELLDRDDA